MSYQYSNLRAAESTRLLVLSPGVGNEPLTGQLKTTLLDTPGEYEALSYAWGSEAKPHELRTNEGSIRLTQTLYDALRDVRIRSRERLLWADAICINQDDNHEKSQQVLLMGKIYASATRVIVYLGAAADRSDEALELLQGMASPEWTDEGEDGAAIRKRFADCDLSPVAAIMNRPWWQRAWVVQEFVNAKNVCIMVGTWELHWQTVFQAIDRTASSELDLSRYQKEYPNCVRATIAFATLDLGRDNPRAPMLDLLDLFQDGKATMKRDRLFSLLALSNDTSDDLFRPDYKEPLDSMVRRYAEAFVAKGHIAHLLGIASPDLSTEHRRFPTWIPDWTTRRYARFPAGVASVHNCEYQAGGTGQPIAYYDRTRDSLIITGVLVDRIKAIIHGPPLRPNPHQHGIHRKGSIREYVNACLDALQNDSTKELSHEVFDGLRRTLTLDRDRFGYPLEDDEAIAMQAAYEVLTKKNSANEEPVELTDATQDALHSVRADSNASDLTGTDNAFCFAVEALTDSLSFAVTEKGFMCLVPTMSLPGDWISVLHGCQTPFVLRPTSSSEITPDFLFIRKAYLHGFMNGEALSDARLTSVEMGLK